MTLSSQHPGHAEAGELLRRVLDAFDLKPDGVKCARNLLERCRRVDVVLEPGEGELHAGIPTPPDSVGTSSALNP